MTDDSSWRRGTEGGNVVSIQIAPNPSERQWLMMHCHTHGSRDAHNRDTHGGDHQTCPTELARVSKLSALRREKQKSKGSPGLQGLSNVVLFCFVFFSLLPAVNKVYRTSRPSTNGVWVDVCVCIGALTLLSKDTTARRGNQATSSFPSKTFKTVDDLRGFLTSR